MTDQRIRITTIKIDLIRERKKGDTIIESKDKLWLAKVATKRCCKMFNAKSKHKLMKQIENEI